MHEFCMWLVNHNSYVQRRAKEILLSSMDDCGERCLMIHNRETSDIRRPKTSVIGFLEECQQAQKTGSNSITLSVLASTLEISSSWSPSSGCGCQLSENG